MQNTGNRNAYGQNRARRHPENIDRTHRPAAGNRTANNHMGAGSRSASYALQEKPVAQGRPARSVGTQAAGRSASVRQGDYRFTAQPTQQRSAARQGRPVTSNRSDAGRHPRVDPKEAEPIENNGITYILSSCDMIDFKLREVLI